MSKNTTLKVPKKEENIKTVSAWHGKATNHGSELSKSHKSITKRKSLKKSTYCNFQCVSSSKSPRRKRKQREEIINRKRSECRFLPFRKLFRNFTPHTSERPSTSVINMMPSFRFRKLENSKVCNSRCGRRNIKLTSGE